MKRLNDMEAVLLYGEAPDLHMDTLKVATVHAENSGSPFTFEAFGKSFEERLRRWDPLRWCLIENPWRNHHAVWVEDSEVDLGHHLPTAFAPAVFRRKATRAAANAHRTDGALS